MVTYENYLDSLELFPREAFEEIIASLPDIDFDISEINDLLREDTTSSKATEIIINEILYTHFGYNNSCSNVNFDNRTFRLKTESSEDLEEIKEAFSKWTIYNYCELKEEIKECQEREEKRPYLNYLNTLPLEELESIVESIKANKNDD